MKSIRKDTINIYYIAYTDNVFSSGIIEIGNVMDTGLENLEVFHDEKSYLNRCKELKIDIESVINIED